MLPFVLVAFVVVSLWAPFLSVHFFAHGFNFAFASITLFCAINLLICFWEICLYVHIDHIKHVYEGKKKKVEKGSLGKIFLFQDAPLTEMLSMKFWGDVWVRGFSTSFSF